MPWKSPQPTAQWSDKERVDFFREVWQRAKFGSFAMNLGAPGLIGAGAQASFVVAQAGGDVASQAVTGLRVGMPIQVTAPNVMPNGLFVQARVAVNDQLQLTFSNTSLVILAVPAGNWSFMGMVL